MNRYAMFQKSQLIGLGILGLLVLLLLLAIQESWLSPTIVQRPAVEEAFSNQADLALAPDVPAAAGVEYLEEGPRADYRVFTDGYAFQRSAAAGVDAPQAAPCADAGNVLVSDAETGGVVNR